MHSEERAISLERKKCRNQPRLARNQSQVRNSVRPIHLFGRTLLESRNIVTSDRLVGNYQVDLNCALGALIL